MAPSVDSPRRLSGGAEVADDNASQPAKPSMRKDVWTLVKEAKEREKKAGENPDTALETNLVVVGSKQGGKSSIILRFLDRDEAPTPTVGLEYTFGRRTRGVNAVKDVTHIWELAGGTYLSDLIDVPITETNIHTTTFIIVVDLSQPQSHLQILLPFLGKVTARVTAVLDSLGQRGSKRPKALRAYAWKKFTGEAAGHPDKDAVNLSPVPMVIIGTKYDLFRDMESEKRKLVCKTLRFLAHTNGASLLFVSNKDENLVAKCRQMLNHHAFKGSPLKTMSVDHNKPVCVVAGQDALSQIGHPPSLHRDANTPIGIGNASLPTVEAWKADYERYFPVGNEQDPTQDLDFSKFAEPSIDAMRAQKDEELSRLRRSNERRSKEKDALAGIVGAGGAEKERRKGKAYSRARAGQMGTA
ncbi:Cytoplasmic dynein 2 light intermediate chain 1 [Borealophlyctis nickersoniae]|nr:Cytoplasmic dynein 2 light intermediate chain 1 [Borealophlyctis nickersoniae]